MADEDEDVPSEEEGGRQEARGEDFRARNGISERSYSQVFEECVKNALAPGRPVVPLADQRNWVRAGPRNIGGRITALAQDPRNPQIIYAGSAFGGLWRSIDAGDTWENIGPTDLSVPIGAIAIPEGNPDF